MFDIDRWQEIFDTINKNRLRTFLTGLSVASGIFILVILLGFGNGMENGIRKEFENDATNIIWIWSQTTTKEYKGLNPGRRIELKNENYDRITKTYKDKIEYKSGIYRVQREGASVNYGKEAGSYAIMGVFPDLQQLESQTMMAGRYINQADLDGKKKVIVISGKVARELMPGVSDPIDEYIKISGISFKVVGVFKDAAG